MTWQKIRMSSNGFIVTLWLTAERFIAAFSRSGTSFHLENHITWFYDGCAADRSLRQRLQGPRCLCSRCRACEAANGNAVAAKPESAICLENHIAWFDDGCAADRSLRQRLQGSRCLCSRCRACEAANGNAVAAKPESAICLENHIAWFYAGYAVDRRLRQRLQGPRCLCSRCRACEAANGNAVAAKPESAICLETTSPGFTTAAPPIAG
ncbi:hypothetical protein [Pseudomonas chlororaphis]|uniref:hypothetical protein n=1 Tax=Pseudomonas chlororaphis TaxID=587753 RepID=UPI00236773B8|nr:hypothetical protein [Pseudomonas chlororaphis]WDG45922.1 hypothetical protein PUP58_19415 [Pseudomonas chlororaphis]